MSEYLLYGTNLIKDDSTLKSFAKSIFDNLEIHYDHLVDYDEFKEASLNDIYEHIRDDISRTDINYEKLMYRYRNEIGDLMYEMDHQGYDMNLFPLHFFGPEARKSFEPLLFTYIDIHFEELSI